MSDDTVIKVENLTKIYKLYNSPVDRLKESLHPFRKQYHHDFYAINDVSFEIKKGESVGIIGKNGSGKSTLLKILTGVLTPTSGRVAINGKVSALLELGAGFNPELNGLDNIYFNGMLMGYQREEMKEMMDDILSFADIGEFVNQPVKSYSSGMFVRLAFATAVNIEPEILIVDEALSVGDIFFQKKCYLKIQEMIDKGVSTLFVSHDTAAVLKLCNKAILIDSGKMSYSGEPIQAISRYLAKTNLNEENKPDKPILNNSKTNNKLSTRHGSGGARILSVNVTDLSNNVSATINMMGMLIFEVIIRFEKQIVRPSVGIHLFDRFGNLVFASGTHRIGCNIAKMEIGDVLRLLFNITFNVQQGEYIFSIGVTDMTDLKTDTGTLLDRIDMLGPIKVTSSFEDICPFAGIAKLPMETMTVEVTKDIASDANLVMLQGTQKERC